MFPFNRVKSKDNMIKTQICAIIVCESKQQRAEFLSLLLLKIC